MTWLIILTTTLIFIAVLFTIHFFYIIFRGYAPFVSTKGKVISSIINEISFNEGQAVYELGCGNAGFLRAIEIKFPKIKELTGVEYFLFPFVITKIQMSLQRSKIKILKKNMFDLNLGRADVIYCYLNKGMMVKLKEKFKKECRPDTQIISYQFPMPDMVPAKVIEVEDRSVDKVYFYKM